jgi:branched-chain amino acid transport system permease protein
MIMGALVAGAGAVQGLFPYALEKWFGLSGNNALLIGGLALIATLLLNPDGVAGTSYAKKRRKRRLQQAGVPGAAAARPSVSRLLGLRRSG